ncbi:hypothetical protein FOA52_004562 [Chlamydomonas sp. UWO 241]|nr:hypothetical protein FOA52_004562 [Chlamydomonas sp. UWO 241]
MAREGSVFQLDTGGVPCDMVLKLPCGVELPALRQFIQVASPFLKNALEDVEGGAPIPVDGSFGTWVYILTQLYQRRDPPDLTLRSVYVLLPVVHKYDFTMLLTRLKAFIKKKIEALSYVPSHSHYVIRWLALAERLQLDDLRELCLGRLRSMTRKEIEEAITVEVEVQVGAATQKKRTIREEVRQLGQELCFEVLAIGIEATDPVPESAYDDNNDNSDGNDDDEDQDQDQDQDD